MKLTVSVNDARASLGLGKTKLYELINKGQLSTIRAGRRRLVTVASLRDFVERSQA